MAEAQQLFYEVLGELSRWGIAGRYDSAIGPETEIFHDLRIYGDDLYELVVWLNKKVGVETNIELGRYGPPETPFPRIHKLITRRQYDGLKFRDVVAAIKSQTLADRQTNQLAI